MAEATRQVPMEVLPAELRARMNGELDGQDVLDWSEFDLDDENRYAKRFAVLTDRQLVVTGGASPVVIPISDIGEAKIVEGLGVDRLRVLVGGKVAAELRYTHRYRRGMTRLQRKLERRPPRQGGGGAPGGGAPPG